MVKKTQAERGMRSHWLLRGAHPRLRLAMAAFVGAATFLLLSSDLRFVTRLLIGWDAGVIFYLTSAFSIMWLSTIADIRQRAAIQDEGRVALLILTVAAALASLGAIIVEIGKSETPDAGGNLIISVITILLSWAFIHVIFAFHYAHEFYAGGHKPARGLQFPGETEADYWDFLYFSFVIGMTSQTSDVQITSRAIRQTVLAHSVAAFVFNSAIVALTVNIAASAL